VERPTAIRAESTARHSETVQVGRSQTAAAKSSIRGWDEVISEVAKYKRYAKQHYTHAARLIEPNKITQTKK